MFVLGTSVSFVEVMFSCQENHPRWAFLFLQEIEKCFKLALSMASLTAEWQDTHDTQRRRCKLAMKVEGAHRGLS